MGNEQNEQADQWRRLVGDCLEMITSLVEVMRDEYTDVGVEEEELAALQARYGALLAMGQKQNKEGGRDPSEEE